MNNVTRMPSLGAGRLANAILGIDSDTKIAPRIVIMLLNRHTVIRRSAARVPVRHAANPPSGDLLAVHLTRTDCRRAWQSRRVLGTSDHWFSFPYHSEQWRVLQRFQILGSRLFLQILFPLFLL